MSKELFVSSSPHETKVAVFEDDQLVEVYHEREDRVGLVGGIYKGRVSRVLPGMQSAFVDIGLERDAFLYVSDFFEDAEEYDKIVTEAEARVTRYSGLAEAPPTSAPAAAPVSVEPGTSQEAGENAPSASPPVAAGPAQSPGAEAAPTVSTPPAPTSLPAPEAPASPPVDLGAAPSSLPEKTASETQEFRRNDHRGRRRRHHGRGFGDRRFGPKPEFGNRPVERPKVQNRETHSTFEILPGESLAKYRGTTSTNTSLESPPAEGPVSPVSPIPPPARLQQPVAGPIEAVEVEAPAEESRGIEVAETRAEMPAETTPEPPSIALLAPISEIPPRSDRSAGAPAATPSEPQAEDKPRPLWERLVSTVFGETPLPAEQKEVPVEGQAPVPEQPAETREALVGTLQVAQVPPVGVAKPSIPPSGATLPSASEPAVVKGATAEASTPVSAPPPGAPAEPAERQYTLREPNQRPRFAPRRGRRGRRPGGPRPQGGPGFRKEPSRPGNSQPLQIAELLKEGQGILVQIAKEPLGRKGARITSHIALPGRYLVYMPTVDHIGVSRKIASEEERLRLRNVILESKGSLNGGFIVRTAGAGRSDEELKADVKFLSSLWSGVRAKAEQAKAPALIHRDLDLVQRILRDILSPDFKNVRVDNEAEYERVVEFVSRCQPSLVGHVKLYTRDTPMFEEFGIQAEIDKALKPKVWLKSGGSIVINQTEALVAIDVNTGKYVGKTNRLEDTILKTNIDAVKEIVWQIRLRDLGGIIVIDFIDMDERRNRNKVVQALEEALRHDRAPTKILSFNDFGLVALTRKRVKQSLERTICEPCQYCAGSGWIKSTTTICYEILAEAGKMARQLEGNALTLRVNPEVAQALKAHERALIQELETLTHKDVIVKADPTVHQERFEIY